MYYATSSAHCEFIKTCNVYFSVCNPHCHNTASNPNGKVCAQFKMYLASTSFIIFVNYGVIISHPNKLCALWDANMYTTVVPFYQANLPLS